jgi:hypothetical protein
VSTAYVPPVISISHDEETGEYTLMAENFGRAATVGPRIFRAEPWPAVKAVHTDAAGAERDAETLRDYLADCASGKRRESAAKPTRRGWWQD